MENLVVGMSAKISVLLADDGALVAFDLEAGM